MRTRAWRNIIAAAYPETRVRWRSVLGAYLGGVGLNALTPARGGDVLKLYLVKHRIEGSTYPTLAATLVAETLFDAFVGLGLLVWAIHLGVLPSLDALDRIPSIDWGWPLQYPRVAEAGALVLGIVIGALLVIATRRVRAFWRRVAQGFAIVRRPRTYLLHVVTWQALSWAFRLAGVYWMLRAFDVPASVHNALLVQLAQSMSTVLPITPGGAGTEQGLLLYLLPRHRRTNGAALLQRRHAHRDRCDQRPARSRRRCGNDAVLETGQLGASVTELEGLRRPSITRAGRGGGDEDPRAASAVGSVAAAGGGRSCRGRPG